MDRIGYTGIYGKIFRLEITRVLKQIFAVLFGPISTYGFYHYDIITDILQIIALFSNCHWRYGFISILFIVISYITSVIHLILFMDQDLFTAISYPYYHV